MNAREFEAWFKVWGELPKDDEWWSDRCCEAVAARVEVLEGAAEQQTYEPATVIADAVKWAAFWLAAGAVGVSLVWRLL